MHMIKIVNDPVKKIHNFWNNIHFHPTDAIEDDWGRRILDQVAADNAAETVRMYAMLEDIVSMGENGELKYDFTLNDLRLDYMMEKGFKIFLSYNFIPPCIASDSGSTSTVCKNKTRYKGKVITTSPPKDYALWEEVCCQYTKHIVERYGEDTVAEWDLQCYNEPDISLFFMTGMDESAESQKLRLENYCKLYKHFANGVMRVSPKLRVGGPALAHSHEFMDGFLAFVRRENLRLDFISLHTYGTTPKQLNDETLPFHAENTLTKHLALTTIIDKHYPDGIEVIVDEWGAATAGFYNREECPKLMLREDSRYAAYFGKMIKAYADKDINISKMMICLSGQHEMVEDFSGFRNFFTLNFIRKPIYNAYVLARKLHDNLLNAEYDNSDMSVMATKSDDDKYAVLISYASENFDKDLPNVDETIGISNISGERDIKIWCIDEKHVNPYMMSVRNGWDKFTPKQIDQLRKEGELVPMEECKVNADGTLKINVSFTNNALVLVEF